MWKQSPKNEETTINTSVIVSANSKNRKVLSDDLKEEREPQDPGVKNEVVPEL